MQRTNSVASGSKGSGSSAVDRGNFASPSTRFTEVVLHINNRLGRNERRAVEQSMCTVTGIREARYCDSHPNLMVVAYDARRVSTKEMRDHFQRRGLVTHLIGILPAPLQTKAE
jgi:hypothetical protein